MVALAPRRPGRAPFAPDREQQGEEREPELVDQRKRIGQHQVDQGQQREQGEQGREAKVQAADEASQECHAPSI